MTEFLQNLLYSVLTAAVPVITAFILYYLNRFFDKIAESTENSEFHETVESVTQLVSDVVDMISQTYVDALRAAGTFDEEAHKLAFDMAKSRIMSLMNERSKEIIKTLYGDVDEWLTIQIESKVRNNKFNSLISQEGIIVEEGEN